jgi:hypothetical protein
MGHVRFLPILMPLLVGENVEALLESSQKAGLERNPEETKYMLMLRYRMSGQKHSTEIANRCFEDVANFKYLETTLTDRNCMLEKIRSRLFSGNACYHLVQSLLSSRLLPKNVNIKIHKTIFLPFVLHGCESWSVTLGKEYT